MKTGIDMTIIKQRFDAWFNGDLHEGPLLWLVARHDMVESLERVEPPKDPYDMYTNVERICAEYRNYLRTHTFMADAFPAVDLNLGPGSLSLYLGSEPIFAWDTVWYKEVEMDTWHDYPLSFDPNNKWWKTHLDMHKRAQALLGGEAYITIPDIIENMDIISAMRGPMAACYDLMDDMGIVKQRLDQLDDLYFQYYDAIYDVVKDNDGGSAYTAFKIIGPGKTAKVQCDFNALMSPEHFRALVVPSLRKQCSHLSNSMFHLDGPDAIKHLPALMEIEQLNALQWTSGAGNSASTDECWYPIFDQVAAAGKSIWLDVGGDAYEVIEKARKFVKRYGNKSLYLLLWDMNREDAAIVMKEAAKGFK